MRPVIHGGDIYQNEIELETEDIKRADRLLYATAVLCEAICLFVLLVILLIS